MLRRIGILLLLLLFVTPLRMQSPDARVIAMDSRLRIRSEPNRASATVAVIEPGTALTIMGKSSGSVWVQVATEEDVIGWVMVDYVELTIDLDGVPVTYDQGLFSQGNKFPPNVAENIISIYNIGQRLHNYSDVFSKVGDSITANTHFLTSIGEGNIYLGEYEYLQPVIDHYRDSFSRLSLAAGVGWGTSAMFDADLADKTVCEADETPLECEYRVAQPSVALIMLGTNDLSYLSPFAYRDNLAGIVDLSIERGIIPVVSTIPQRVGYEDQVAEYNSVVAQIAQDFAVPLWDYGGTMQSLPNGGLDVDGIHPTIAPMGYKGAGDFHDYNLPYGYVMRNLTALQMLDAVWQTVEAAQTADVQWDG